MNEELLGIWESIVTYFDFDRILKTMESLDWSYYDTKNNKYKKTTKYIIIKTAKQLVIDAYNNKQSCSTGGFEAIYIPKEQNEDNVVGIQLKFVVESWVGQT